jgi:hypothetical protein
MRSIIKHIVDCNSLRQARCKKHEMIFCFCEANGLCPECDMEMKTKPLATHTPTLGESLDHYGEEYCTRAVNSHEELLDLLKISHSDCLACEKGRLNCPYQKAIARAEGK